MKESKLLFNEGAEKAVISSIFYNSEALDKALVYLKPHDFYNYTNGLIFQAMINLAGRNDNIDPVTVFNEISKCTAKPDLSEHAQNLLSIPEYLETLSMYLATDKTIGLYARIVKEQSIRRSILVTSRAIVDSINDPTKKIEEVVQEAQKKILSVEIDYLGRNFYPAKVVANRVFDEIYDRSLKNRELDLGIISGFEKVDSLLHGFKNSDFIILGARPSVGKTAFALGIAANIAFNSSRKSKVGFFSLEMTADALMKRILSFMSNINSFKIQNGILNSSEIKVLNEVIAEINNSDFYIEDTPNMSLIKLMSEARKMKKYHGVNVIFIDYISLIAFDMKNLPRHEQVATISRSLKELARELEIPVIALSQLTRDTEGREPNLASLRESGALEQDADVVMLLHREKIQKESKELGEELEPIETKVLISKHRNGPTGRANILFIPHITKFVNKDYKYSN